MFNKKVVSVIIMLFIGSTVIGKCEDKLDKVIFGGTYTKEVKFQEDKRVDNEEKYYSLERFFRPSKSPILNDKIEKEFFDLYDMNITNYKIPN
ncbi:MAG: hypothetical protein RSC84_06720, partial [Peptostreptococcaceae bacterium]